MYLILIKNLRSIRAKNLSKKFETLKVDEKEGEMTEKLDKLFRKKKDRGKGIILFICTHILRWK